MDLKNKIKLGMQDNKNETVWKDRTTFRMLVTSFLIFCMTLFFIVFLIIQSLIVRIIIIILFVLFVASFFSHLKRKIVLIKHNGIFINNIKILKGGKLKLKQKNIFVSWEAVRNINIINKIVSPGNIGLSRSFLFVITKENKLYTEIIQNPKGFIQTLKKLNKDYLLKDKKRLYEKYGIK